MSHQQKKIRVLFIITLLDRMGGAEKNLCDIVLNLNREKFEPCVLAFKGGHCTETLAARGVPVQENGVGKLFSLSTLRQVFALRRFLRQEKIDLVVTYHHDADIFGLLAAGTAGIPVISSRRDMGYQLEKKHILFYRWFGRFFSHFIAVSHAVKAVLIDREKIPAEKITVIHNGIALDAFPHPDPEKKARLTAELGLSPDKITIGMVASFRPVKGQEFLVEAIAHLPEWHDKIQVVIVGYKDTDYFKKVKLRIDDLGLEKIFIFPGARDDIPEVLHLFDIFVISSRNEGFSNAIIEAMAAGLPVIAADSGGNREAVLNQKTGLLVSPRDSQALAIALQQLLNNHDQCKIMGDDGKKRVAEVFSRTRMIYANENVYKNEIRKVSVDDLTIKQKLKKFILRYPFFLRAAAFATRHLPRIFMYHRFTSEICDSGPAVSRENFAWQLQQIKQGPWTTMTLAEYVFRRRRGYAIPAYTVILTIDDGYQDFYEVAYPLLKEHGFSATFFVTTGFVEDENWFWFDLLRYAIDHAEKTDAEIRFGNHSILLETATKVEKDQTWQRLSDICIDISDHDKWSLIDEVVKKLCVEVPDKPTREYAPATWEQLKEMAENGIEIGAHSSTHPVLSQLDTERLPDEICKPHEILSFCLGRPVETICYPNGRKIDVTSEVMDFVKTAGYRGGVLGGGVDFSDLLRLPRLGVTNDRDDFLWKLYGVEQIMTMKSLKMLPRGTGV